MSVEPVKRPVWGLPPMPVFIAMILVAEAVFAVGVLARWLLSPEAVGSGNFWFGVLMFSFFCFTWLVSRMTRTIEVLERQLGAAAWCGALQPRPAPRAAGAVVKDATVRFASLVGFSTTVVVLLFLAFTVGSNKGRLEIAEARIGYLTERVELLEQSR